MINGNKLRDAIISGANNIANNKQLIDELNIFPVPDGDTGTNMSMTVGNSIRELSRLNDATVETVSDTVASALLRGARGNSGVITSLLFRGLAKGLRGHTEMDGKVFAQALTAGVAAAYKAVMKPTEGTILTVARVAAERATAANTEDFMTSFEAALAGANEALEQTPELLPVLKKAGVVDAGGKGFVTILEGMLSVFKGGVIIESSSAPVQIKKDTSAPKKNAAAEFDGEITFTYCTEFIVNRNPDIKTDPSVLRAFLESIGDSAVVVDDDKIIKVHVHTDHPGKAIEKGIEFGQLVNMKIDNMRDQHARVGKESADMAKVSTASGDSYTPVKPEKPFGFVCVCAGDGIQSLFTELGADMLVSGGQTMNPSTENILKAIEQTPAETVFVLPNNKNIIMAAELAVPLATRKVIVLHTRTIPMGIAAMLNFDPDLDDEQNALNMQKAAANVSTGQITFAARNSDFDGHNIKEGEILALENGKLAFTDTDFVKAAIKLTRSMCKKDTSFISIIYGDNVAEEQALQVQSALSEKLNNDIEINVINGGQPIYYFIISVE